MFRGLGVVARPARAAARSSRAAASSEAKAVVDGLLGSSLPEAAGRTLAEVAPGSALRAELRTLAASLAAVAEPVRGRRARSAG